MTPPDFTIVALPDTQMYAQDYPANFTAQTQWIVNNAATLNIKFVVGLGDIVNVGNSDTQWNNAMSSISLLDSAGIPYALAIGNHDYDESDAWTRISTYYNQYNGIAKYQGRSYYGSSTYPPGQNDNFYAVMPINGDTYLFLMVEYWPRQGAIDWAKTVLASYPGAKVIVVTHGYEGTDNFRTGPHDCGGPGSWGGDNNGEDMWTKFVSQYANIIMVLNGHLPSAPGREFDPGVNGNLINQIVADYQDDPNGGNGWLRVLTFHPNSHTVDVKTYSPTLLQYQVDMGNQFTTPLDTQALDVTQTGFRGRVRAIGAGCSTNAVNGIVSYAQGTNAPAYQIPDGNGYYTTPTNLPAGSYTVKANAQGYAPLVSPVTVIPGYTVPARFYLTATTDEFTLVPSPASQTVVAGSATSFSTTLSSAGSYASAPVTLSAIGLPAGATASFSPATLIGAGSSSMTISTAANVAPGTYSVLISGVSGDMQRIAAISVTVVPPPDFALSPSPGTVSLVQGSQATSTISSTVVGGFAAAVNLSVSGLPAGVTASFGTNPIAAPGSGSSVLTLTASGGAALGNSVLTVTGTGGGMTHTATINLGVVQPADFSLAVSPGGIAIAPGQAGTATVASAIAGLFNSAVSLSVSGLPRRVTASFNPTSVAAPGSGTSTLTLTVASNATLGDSVLTITGTGGGKTHTATLNLTVGSPTPAVMQTPTPGATFTGSSVTFTWSAGTNVTQYWLNVGPAPNAWNIYSQSAGTSTSVTVNNVPTNGQPIYVMLGSLINGAWQYNSYTYTAYAAPGALAVMQTPADGSTLTGSSVTFNWSTGTNVTQYWLNVGPAPNAWNIYSQSAGTNTSVTLNNLPTNGQPIYVLLGSLINGAWQYNSYTYTAYAAPGALAVMQTPANGSTLTGSSVTFNWSAGTNVAQYWLNVGPAPNAWNIYSQSVGANTSTTVNNLPTNGQPIYVLLGSLINGTWQYNSYTYTAFAASGTPAVMQTPTAGSTFSGSSVTFNWSSGTNVSAYWVNVGTAMNSWGLFCNGLGTNTSLTLNNIPTDGQPIYVMLGSLINGTWQYNTYTYTAFAAAGSPAEMLTPTPSSTLSGSLVTFNWSTGTNASAYWVNIGTAMNSWSLYCNGVGTNTSLTVNNLPANGQTVYVMLGSLINGTWQYNTYTYTSGP